MQLNPDSNFFEICDTEILRALYRRAMSAQELATVLQATLRIVFHDDDLETRIAFLIATDFVESIGWDLNTHKELFFVTAAGGNYIQQIENASIQDVKMRTRRLIDIFKREAEAFRHTEPGVDEAMAAGRDTWRRYTEQETLQAVGLSPKPRNNDGVLRDCAFLWDCGIQIDDCLHTLLNGPTRRRSDLS